MLRRRPYLFMELMEAAFGLTVLDVLRPELRAVGYRIRVDRWGLSLEATRLGGRWVTSKEALQRFAERLTPDLDALSAGGPK
jgi:hypothetical protein